VDGYCASQNEGEINITLSGPSLAEDGETMIGSMLLNEAPADAGVKSFIDGDPCTKMMPGTT